MFINNVQAMFLQYQKYIFQQSGDLNFKYFAFGADREDNSWSELSKQ